jgi:hypothetical protein
MKKTAPVRPDGGSGKVSDQPTQPPTLISSALTFPTKGS